MAPKNADPPLPDGPGSVSAKPWRRQIRWTLFVLALVGLGWLLHAWLPLQPRCAIRGKSFERPGLSADGNLISVNRFEGGLQVWDTRSGRLLGSYFRDFTFERVLDFAYSRDGRFFAIHNGETLAMADVVAAREWSILLKTRKADTAPFFSPKAKFLVVYEETVEANAAPPAAQPPRAPTTDIKAHLIDANSGRVAASFPLSSAFATFTPDDASFFFFERTKDGPLFTVWDTRSQQVVRRLKEVDYPYAVSPDSRFFVSPAKPARQPYIRWDMTTGAGKAIVPLGDWWSQWFSRDGRMLAISTDREVELWNLPEPERRATLPVGQAQLVKFSADSRLLAVNSASLNTFTVWDAQTCKLLWERKGPFPDYQGFAVFTPDPRFMMKVEEEKPPSNRIDMLDAATGEIHATFTLAEGADFTRPLPGRFLYSLPPVFTPDGRFFVVARGIPGDEAGLLAQWLGSWWPFASGARNVIVVAEVATGREMFRLETNKDILNTSDVLLSDDGCTLVIIYQEADGNTVQCWDLPVRRPWGWIVGIPLSLGTAAMLVRWRQRPRGNNT